MGVECAQMSALGLSYGPAQDQRHRSVPQRGLEHATANRPLRHQPNTSAVPRGGTTRG